ncbi:hypothetical protein [Actinoplanes siamensis]|uniref:Uncharacterized protein n=1 Tax=Actinoplanes siamensis TaxID=1223317 RepID=A0A919TMJ8_9ACTN|nr:hypothetical protein [Actinoplanes siamensis]GIF08406.1 hypothetical protein Asi03nite_59440 [Actinoplanes siamensis]
MAVQADTVQDLVTEAGRRAVARLAPDELPFYDRVAEQWRERSSPPGSSVGFGIDAAMISEVVLQAISSAFSEILVVGSTAAGAGLLRWARRRRKREALPELTEEHVGRLRDACVRQALALDLTPEQADQLADAVVATISDAGGE